MLVRPRRPFGSRRVLIRNQISTPMHGAGRCPSRRATARFPSRGKNIAAPRRLQRSAEKSPHSATLGVPRALEPAVLGVVVAPVPAGQAGVGRLLLLLRLRLRVRRGGAQVLVLLVLRIVVVDKEAWGV